MTIDMSKMRDRLTKLQSKGSNGDPVPSGALRMGTKPFAL